MMADVLGGFGSTPPPPLQHPPDCDTDVVPVTDLIQSQCAPSLRSGLVAQEGGGVVLTGLLQSQKNLLTIES
jgi:hypothetical protein